MVETTIIVPTKNDYYITVCLEELLPLIKNNRRELIVVNDRGSDKDYSEKLSIFCKKNKIRLIRGEKLGASSNRNTGVKHAHGKKILFIDSDCKPDKHWALEMEKSLNHFDLVEGRVIYASRQKKLLDRVVENSKPNQFLTANLAIRKKVFSKCKFDEHFMVFREDTDFGLCALEKGFHSTLNKKAIIFHNASRFSILKFILEKRRYVGEPIIFKKHIKNKMIRDYVPHISRILHPIELILLLLIPLSLLLGIWYFVFFFFFPGVMYALRQYFIQKRTFDIIDTLLVLFLIPPTLLIQRIYMWKGASKSHIFII